MRRRWITTGGVEVTAELDAAVDEFIRRYDLTLAGRPRCDHDPDIDAPVVRLHVGALAQVERVAADHGVQVDYRYPAGVYLPGRLAGVDLHLTAAPDRPRDTSRRLV